MNIGIGDACGFLQGGCPYSLMWPMHPLCSSSLTAVVRGETAQPVPPKGIEDGIGRGRACGCEDQCTPGGCQEYRLPLPDTLGALTVTGMDDDALQGVVPGSQNSDIASFQAQAEDALLQALTLMIDIGLQRFLGLQPVTGDAHIGLSLQIGGDQQIGGAIFIACGQGNAAFLQTQRFSGQPPVFAVHAHSQVQCGVTATQPGSPFRRYRVP